MNTPSSKRVVAFSALHKRRAGASPQRDPVAERHMSILLHVCMPGYIRLGYRWLRHIWVSCGLHHKYGKACWCGSLGVDASRVRVRGRAMPTLCCAPCGLLVL